MKEKPKCEPWLSIWTGIPWGILKQVLKLTALGRNLALPTRFNVGSLFAICTGRKVCTFPPILVKKLKLANLPPPKKTEGLKAQRMILKSLSVVRLKET